MSSTEVPGDLILPEPESQKEVELNRALQDHSIQVRSALISVSDTEDKVKATSSDPTAGYLDAKVDDSSIEVSSNALRVKALGVTGAMLAAAIAGDGLTQDVSGNLDVNVDDSTIEISTDTVQVKADGITETQIQLSNDAYMTALNNAGGGTVDLIKSNTSDQVVTGAVTVLPDTSALATSGAPAADAQIANKKYVDDQIAGVTSGAMTLLSTTTMTSSTNSGDISITAGKRYMVFIILDNDGGGNATISLRFDSDTDSDYSWLLETTTWSATPGPGSTGASSAAQISLGTINQNREYTGHFIFDATNNGSTGVFVSGDSAYGDASAAQVTSHISGIYTDAGTLTDFEIVTGSAVTGTIKTYEIT